MLFFTKIQNLCRTHLPMIGKKGTSMKHSLQTPHAPPPSFTSQGISVSGQGLFLSGQLPLTCNRRHAGKHTDQTKQALRPASHTAIRRTPFKRRENHRFLKDMNDFAAMNEVCASRPFPGPRLCGSGKTSQRRQGRNRGRRRFINRLKFAKLPFRPFRAASYRKKILMKGEKLCWF